jgi:hypothetical protein
MYYFKTEAEKVEQARQAHSVKDFAHWLATSNDQVAIELRGGVRITAESCYFCQQSTAPIDSTGLCDTCHAQYV